MPYERSRFGDGSTAGNGNVVKTVSNHYGQRDTGGAGGVTRTAGFDEELTIDVTPQMLNEGAFPVEAPYIKRGAKIHQVFVEVVKPFALGGTSPTVQIGTEGSEATNGFTVTKAQMEAVGVYDRTSSLSGTWAAAGGLTGKVDVGVDMGGTSPTADESVDGLVRIVVRYISTNSKAPVGTTNYA